MFPIFKETVSAAVFKEREQVTDGKEEFISCLEVCRWVMDQLLYENHLKCILSKTE